MWTGTDKPNKNQSQEWPTFPGRKKARSPLLNLREKNHVFPMLELYLYFGDALKVKKSCSEYGGNDCYDTMNALNANDFATEILI